MTMWKELAEGTVITATDDAGERYTNARILWPGNPAMRPDPKTVMGYWIETSDGRRGFFDIQHIEVQ